MHQPGANHAPGASVTQVNLSVQILSIIVVVIIIIIIIIIMCIYICIVTGQQKLSESYFSFQKEF